MTLILDLSFEPRVQASFSLWGLVQEGQDSTHANWSQQNSSLKFVFILIIDPEVDFSPPLDRNKHSCEWPLT